MRQHAENSGSRTGNWTKNHRIRTAAGASAMSLTLTLSACAVNVDHPPTTISHCGGLAQFFRKGNPAPLEKPLTYRISVARAAATVWSRIMNVGGKAELPDPQDWDRVNAEDVKPSTYSLSASDSEFKLGVPSQAFISTSLGQRRFDTLTMAVHNGQPYIPLGVVACTGGDEALHATSVAVDLMYLDQATAGLASSSPQG